MDKLQWFKFTPSDWMMGKIQRCPEITQARFLRLCCLYWNKNCEISIEDAEIEIDKEHYDILVSRKIISISETNINISFLDEQNLEIKEVSKDKSTSGIVGNLKRWHFVIYQRFIAKEISLEKAIELSKVVAPQSHTDSTTIAPRSQNIADKIKTRQDEDKEENREENNNTALPFSFFNSLINYGFKKELVSEWIKVRKNKRLTNTETSFKNFIKEIEKTNADKNDIITECIIKSWGGFKSEWYKKENSFGFTEKSKYEMTGAFGKSILMLTEEEYQEKLKSDKHNTYKLIHGL